MKYRKSQLEECSLAKRLLHIPSIYQNVTKRFSTDFDHFFQWFFFSIFFTSSINLQDNFSGWFVLLGYNFDDLNRELCFRLNYSIIQLCYFLLQIYPSHFTGITRLECRHAANFSVRYHHERYDDSPTSKHQNIKKISECIVLCIASAMCSFVNYQSENFTCELMYSYEYLYYDKEKLKPAVNWEFAAPAFKRQQVYMFSIKFIIVCSRALKYYSIILRNHQYFFI